MTNALTAKHLLLSERSVHELLVLLVAQRRPAVVAGTRLHGDAVVLLSKVNDNREPLRRRLVALERAFFAASGLASNRLSCGRRSYSSRHTSIARGSKRRRLRGG